MTDETDNLTPKQRLFVEAYLRTWCGAKAARQAGYAHPDRQGSRLLRNVEVSKVIEARIKEAAMGADEVLARLSEQGRVNIGDFLIQKQIPLRNEDGVAILDVDGQPMMIEGWDIDLDAVKARGHLVKSISATRYGPKIELHDGQAALIHMGKHLKLFTEVQEHQGQVSMVEMTMDEWKKQQSERRAQAASVLNMFDDQIESGNE